MSNFGINSGFFDSYFGTSNANNAGGFSVGDYSLIKSGSYKKLLKKYYAETDNGKKEAGTNSVKENDSTKNLLSTKTSAGALKDVAKKLQTADYDKVSRDGLLKDVKSLVDNYNTTLSSLDNIDNTAILQNGVWMTTQTSKSKKVLNDIGISIGKDNKLSVDEDAFKKADLSYVKSALSGNNSIVASIANRANQMYTISGTQALMNERGSSYTSNGGVNPVSTSHLFNSLL